jgi:hypothetical protein
MAICDYCKNTFTTKAILARHQKRTLYCLELQGKANNIQHQCKYCSRIFARGSSMSRHMKSCPMVATAIDAVEEKLSALQEQITTLMLNGTTSTNVNNRNVVVNNLQPITEEQIQDHLGHLTLDFILEGAKGFADFANSYPFKDRVLCTDKSRRKLKFRDEEGSLVDDGGGHKLIQKFFQAISPRNEELISAEYNILQRKVESIAQEGRAHTSDLTELLSKATRLQDLLHQCKDAAEGKDNDLTQEFIKHYIKIL